MHVTQIATDMKYLVKLISTNQKCKIRIHIWVPFLNLGDNPIKHNKVVDLIHFITQRGFQYYK